MTTPTTSSTTTTSSSTTSPITSRRRLAFVASAIVAIGSLAACGSGSATDTTGGAAEPAPTTTTTVASAPAHQPGGPVLVARTTAALDVFDGPGETATATLLPGKTSFGSPRALLVLEQQPGWLKVALPVRPNGATGWVRAGDVDMREIDQEIVVDLADRTLTLWSEGAEVLTTPIAIGTSQYPTPTGRFFVVDKLATDESGPYGPFALGLSAHSDVLTEFAGGDGQVGIHGTDDPGSIGRAVSHGCIRVPNEIVSRLNDLVPLGTPVTVA